jgi:drug/metabolite transporter (DMT)-like permease
VRRWLSLSPFDGLLLLMVLIWGANYSVIKSALREIPPQAFNAMRLVVATAVFLASMGAQGWPRVRRADWWRIALLGAIGHFVYQICFMAGISRTTASNSSLIIGCSPIVVSLTSAWAGHERVPRSQWIGVALSALGIYLVVGQAAEFDHASLIGDAFTFGAVCCWAAYTVGSRGLLERYSPLAVTGLTMVAGTALLVPASAGELASVAWSRVPVWAWAALVLSALLALNFAYLVWYTSVQRIGNVRTSAYSNFIPLVAMTVAALTLGEPVTWSKAFGAGAVVSGVALTRVVARRQQALADPPAEE